jgi:hypothetical protein
MSKPEQNSRRRDATLLQRLFFRREGTRADGQTKKLRRQSRTAGQRGLTANRRVRLVFFSTWGSDYRQIDLSAATFAGILLGLAGVFGVLAGVATHFAGRLVESYRLSSLNEEHQALRNRLTQMQTRVQNLGQRLNGLDGEGTFDFTHGREQNDTATLPGKSDAGSAALAETDRARASGPAKRGPLGLAWADSSDVLFAEDENEAPVFYGQGGGAYIDDEDNVYPNLLEKERANSFIHAAKAETENHATAAGAGGDLISQLEAHLSQTQALQKTIVEKFEIRRKQLEHIPSIKPLLSGRITDLFGKRKDPFVYRTRHHQGLDIGAPRGTEVFAPANGVVEFVKFGYRRKSGYGKAVVINHGYGIKTLYGHLSAINVKAGQKIERWDLVGLVGETGRATGPHLHYEVWVDGEATDPMRFILNN